jgi:hypothetical protein
MTPNHVTRKPRAGTGSRSTRSAHRLRRPARRLILAGLLAALPGVLGETASGQSPSVVVEDWAKAPVGTKGIPPGWQGQKWGDPRYDFTVVQDGAGKALQLKSADDSSSISKEIKVDVKQYPILEWTWKVVALPPRGHARKAETDDEAAQIYVTFPRFPTTVRSRIIGYIWDSTEPAGASFQSAKVSSVHFIVVRSGSADLGKWITERRNVLEDYKKIYGESPGEPAGAITLSINSQNTGSRAESLFGNILFKKP